MYGAMVSWMLLFSVAFGQEGKSAAIHLRDQCPMGRIYSLLDSDQILFQFETQKARANEANGDSISLRIAPNDWIAWGGQVVGDQQARLLLVDGTILVGKCAEWRNDEVVWESQRWGAVTVPRSLVSGVLWKPLASFSQQLQFISHVYQSQNAVDGIYSKSGDWLEGIVREIVLKEQKGVKQPAITWKSKQDSDWRSLEFTEVLGIRFASTLPLNLSSVTRLAFHDGEVLWANGWGLNQDQRWRISLSIPLELIAVASPEQWIGQICGVERDAGNATRLLTRETPATYRHLPWGNLKIPLGVNRTCFNEPLVVNGVYCREGLATPTASQVAFRHDGSRSAFCSALQVRSSDRAGDVERSKVVGKVLVSRDAGLEVAWTSSPMRADEKEQTVRLDLQGVRAIVLVTESEQEFRPPNELVWRYPRIEKDSP